MQITPEQRRSWAERTARSPFNRWLTAQTTGADGRLDLDRLYTLALEYGIDKRAEYSSLNPGQQRMSVGNALRTRVPASVYATYTEDEAATQPRVFTTRFWGFDPAVFPFVAFTYEGSRSSLIDQARPGDLVAVVGTMSEPTAANDRGRFLGLIEFLRTPMQAEDLLLLDHQNLPPHLLDEAGQFKWPYAVPGVRAWRFEEPPLIRDAIGRQLTMAATTGVDPLSEKEAEQLLSFPTIEVELPPSRPQLRQERLDGRSELKPLTGSTGQPGPPPSEWSALTAHMDGPTDTYLMRFGARDIWKIGISQNHAQRCKALNFSVPSEVLNGECWKVEFFHRWQNGAEAYAMEQAVLAKLAPYATINERIRTTEAIISRTWQDYLMGRL